MQMPEQRINQLNTINDQNNKGNPEENLKTSRKELKVMEICDLNVRIFKTAVLKSSTRYKKTQAIHKLRNKISEQKGLFY